MKLIIKNHSLDQLFHTTPNGQLESRIEYKDGLKDGLSETFIENGQILTSKNYKDGQKNGLVESYYEDGTLQRK